jgi:ABC-type branched-subunit amino acid transport system permease subunit
MRSAFHSRESGALMLSYLVAMLILGGIYALLTISLDLQYGHTGLVNFGLVGFFAVGAYGSALVALAGYPIAAGFAVGISARRCWRCRSARWLCGCGTITSRSSPSAFPRSCGW